MGKPGGELRETRPPSRSPQQSSDTVPACRGIAGSGCPRIPELPPDGEFTGEHGVYDFGVASAATEEGCAVSGRKNDDR